MEALVLPEYILAHRGNIFLLTSSFPRQNISFRALVPICLFVSVFIIQKFGTAFALSVGESSGSEKPVSRTRGSNDLAISLPDSPVNKG